MTEKTESTTPSASETHVETRASSFWLALLVGAITLAVFSPVVRNGFLRWDDDYFVCGNPDLAHPTAAGLAKFWTHLFSGYNQFSVPLTYSVWWLTARLHPAGPGGNPVLFPWVFHTLNLAFHTAAAILAFLVLRRIVRSPWAALSGALLFALHPLQVEPVAWVANMYTPLSGALALAALLAWLKYSSAACIGPNEPGVLAPLELPCPNAEWPGTKWVVFAIGTICYTLALLSKPSIILLPLIAVVIDVLLRGRRLRDCIPLALWLAIGLVDAVITSHVHEGVRAFRPALWQRPLVAGDSLAFYLGRLIFPVGLVPDYGRTPQWVLSHGWVWATAAIGPAILAICWMVRRRAPWLLAGAIVFILGALPMLGLVPFDFQGFSTVGDRYVYLSLLGAAIAIAFVVECISGRILSPFPPPVLRGRVREGVWTSDVTRPAPPPQPSPGVPGAGELRLTRRHGVELIAMGCILAVLIPLCRVQIGRWKNTRTLFDYTLAVNPNSAVAHLQLGYMLLTGGTTPTEWNEALNHYEAVAVDRPDDVHLQCNLGMALLRLGRPADAVAHFRLARQLDPHEPSAAYLLGAAFVACHDKAGAITAFESAIHDFPNLSDAELRLAGLLADAGDASSAANHYRHFLKLHPDSSEALAGLQRLPSAQQQAATDLH